MQDLPQAALAVGPAAKVLDATNNRLASLPAATAQMVNLQRLVLTSNQFAVVPAAVVQLTNLKVWLLGLPQF